MYPKPFSGQPFGSYSRPEVERNVTMYLPASSETRAANERLNLMLSETNEPYPTAKSSSTSTNIVQVKSPSHEPDTWDLNKIIKNFDPFPKKDASENCHRTASHLVELLVNNVQIKSEPNSRIKKKCEYKTL